MDYDIQHIDDDLDPFAVLDEEYLYDLHIRWWEGRPGREEEEELFDPFEDAYLPGTLNSHRDREGLMDAESNKVTPETSTLFRRYLSDLHTYLPAVPAKIIPNIPLNAVGIVDMDALETRVSRTACYATATAASSVNV